MLQNMSFVEMDRDFRAMGCHLHPERPATGCAGFMVQVGFESIGVRIAVLRGVDHPDNYTDGGHELYGSFDEMLAVHHAGVKRAS